MSLLDRVPLLLILAVALLLALAPLKPQPHLVEKITMMFNGELSKPIDIFDLFWHSWALILLVVKLIRMKFVKRN